MINVFSLDSTHLPTLIATWVPVECRGGKRKSGLLFRADLQCRQLLQAQNQIAPILGFRFEKRGGEMERCGTLWSSSHGLSVFLLINFLWYVFQNINNNKLLQICHEIDGPSSDTSKPPLSDIFFRVHTILHDILGFYTIYDIITRYLQYVRFCQKCA